MMYAVRLFVPEDPTFSAEKCICILDRGQTVWQKCCNDAGTPDGRGTNPEQRGKRIEDEKMELLTFGTFYVLVK
jgi:hypothetical protein